MNAIQELETRRKIDIVILPSKHLETPAYNVERIKSDDTDEKPSHLKIKAETISVPEFIQKSSHVAEKPAIKEFLPDAPAPVRNKKSSSSLIQRFWHKLVGNSEDITTTSTADKTKTTKKSSSEEKPRSNRNRNKNERPRRSNNQNRNPRRNNPNQDSPKNTTAEENTRSQNETPANTESEQNKPTNPQPRNKTRRGPNRRRNRNPNQRNPEQTAEKSSETNTANQTPKQPSTNTAKQPSTNTEQPASPSHSYANNFEEKKRQATESKVPATNTSTDD